MSGILMPEVIIYNTLESIVNLLRKDLETTREEETILYRLLSEDEDGNELKMNSYNFFRQAKKIVQNPGNLNVNFGYNQEVARIISLHIILPTEQGEAVIGMDEGYIQDENEVGVQNYFTSSFKSTYQIMITSDNSSEVNLVYNIFKSVLIMLYEHLEIKGLRIPSLSGNDIIMQDDLSPIPIFHKVLNLSFFYELNVPKLLKDQIARNFYFESKAVLHEEETSIDSE